MLNIMGHIAEHMRCLRRQSIKTLDSIALESFKKLLSEGKKGLQLC